MENSEYHWNEDDFETYNRNEADDYREEDEDFFFRSDDDLDAEDYVRRYTG